MERPLGTDLNESPVLRSWRITLGGTVWMVMATNWLIALGEAAHYAKLELGEGRLAFEVLLNGTVLVTHVSARQRYVVERIETGELWAA